MERVIELVILLIAACLVPGVNSDKTFAVVGVFANRSYTSSEHEDYRSTQVFQHAMDYVVPTNFTLNRYMKSVNSKDVYSLAKYMCDMASREKMAALIGANERSLNEFMQTFSKKKRIPYLELTPPANSSRLMEVHMHPDPVELVQLLHKLMFDKNKDSQTWGWHKVFIAYEQAVDFDRYLELFSLDDKGRLMINSHHMEEGHSYTATLDLIHQTRSYHIIVDCKLFSVNKFLNKALEKQMLTKEYHYHFTSLDLHTLNLRHYSYGGANITWSQLVNWSSADAMPTQFSNFKNYLKGQGILDLNKHKYYLTTHNALLVDAVFTLKVALNLSSYRDGEFTAKELRCNNETDSWNKGSYFKKAITLQKNFYGLTGNVQFTSSGKRTNYKLHIMRLKTGGDIQRIGEYTSGSMTSREGKLHLLPLPPPPKQNGTWIESFKHKVLNITTIDRDPFYMLKSEVNGTDKPVAHGYVVDLMKHIAHEANASFNLQLRYQFNLVKDGKFGNNITKTAWNGMVGEVHNGTADMAIAPLTINSDREAVIDFTKPFMTFGIAILYKLPEVAPPDMMSFSLPIRHDVWLLIAVAVLGVSLSMYLLSRFTPLQWDNPFPCQPNYEYLENDFNLSNAFWFSVGSLMQQGCDIMPKAPSTRIIAISWWLFTLIIISSYTANLAAFLTITTLSDTFESTDELAAQTAVPYGCEEGGNTCKFFEDSDIAVYREMWQYMSTTTGVMAENSAKGVERVKNENYAFLMESPGLQYEVNTDKDCKLTQVGPKLNSISYGIAVPEGDRLRDYLSDTLLKLKEQQVLMELKNKWWKVDDSTCSSKSSSTSSEFELKSLQGIFVFLAGGLGLAGIFLCIEILTYAIAKSRREKVSVCEILRLWIKYSLNGEFPRSAPNSSIDQASTSYQSYNHPGNSIKANAKHSMTEEEMQPLNGHTDRHRANHVVDNSLTF